MQIILKDIKIYSYELAISIFRNLSAEGKTRSYIGFYISFLHKNILCLVSISTTVTINGIP